LDKTVPENGTIISASTSNCQQIDEEIGRQVERVTKTGAGLTVPTVRTAESGDKSATSREVEHQRDDHVLGDSTADGEDERPTSESDSNDDVSNSKSNSNCCSKNSLLASSGIKRNARP
jgi:hypothetical protein